MKIFRLKKNDKNTVKQIATSFKNKETFKILTDDPNFNPLGSDKHSIDLWLGAIGGGLLMLIGSGAIYLGFIDPEPTSKLTILTGGGVLMALSGGGIIFTIIVARKNYQSTIRFNPETNLFEWELSPK